MQDSKGYLWLATDRGVSRFNGETFVNYTSTSGLENNTVLKIVEDRQGRIWFLSTEARLCYFLDGKIHAYENNDKLEKSFNKAHINVYTRWVFTDDEIVIGTLSHGTRRIDSVGNVTNLKPNQEKLNKKSILQVFQHNTYLVNSSLVQKEKGLNQPYEMVLNSNQISGVMSMSVKSLYLGEYNGYKYLANGNRVEFFKGQDRIVHDFKAGLISFIPIGNEIWVGFVGNGVKRFSFGPNGLTELDHFFKGRSISHIFKTKTNEYFFSSLHHGVLLVRDIGISKLIGGPEVSGVINSVACSANNLLFQNANADLVKFNLDNKQYRLITEIPRLTFHGLIECKGSEDIYVNVRHSKTYKYEDHEFLIQDMDYEVRSILKFNESQLLIGANAQIILSGKQKRSYALSSMPGHIEFRDSNSIWLSQYNGLKILNIHTGKTSRPNREILKRKINDVLNVSGRTFFGTHGNGLLIEDSGQIKHFSENEGQNRKFIAKILCDVNNSVWLISENGVTSVKEDKEEGYSFRNYEENILLCEKILSSTIDKNYLYLGTNSGVLRVNINGASDMVDLPDFLIKEALSGIEKLDFKSIRLPYDKNDISFELDKIDFKSENILFRFRTHSEQSWQNLEEKTLRFNALGSGSYQLEIQASRDGVNWTKSKTIRFDVEPPYWKETWFVILVIMISLSLIYFTIKWREYYIKKRHEDQRHLIQLQQEALTQQMNPHFVFNALGSVQNSILKGDAVKANSFLVKFSRLLRSGLNASRNQLISLEEDRELMENYLTVEQLRLGDALSFSVELISELSVHELLISPFLLQPFIENSIKHGLQDGEQTGSISVKYLVKSDEILCIIEDDGIGREKSSKIKGDGDHLSHGSKIAHERIELFNRSYGVKTKLEIRDLSDDQEMLKGTRVEFTVPLIFKK